MFRALALRMPQQLHTMSIVEPARSIATHRTNRHHLWLKWPPSKPECEPFLHQNLWSEKWQGLHPINLDCPGTDLPGPL